MSGNTIGGVFRVTTWGESHGAALGAVIDGCPAGINLCAGDIQKVIDRRKPKNSLFSTSRAEPDSVEILSGVFEDITTGTPISLLIRNKDADPSAYNKFKDIFRPGHGDFTYWQKYGIRDWRGGGRASGRETVARVAAGAVAEKIITAAGIDVVAYTAAIGAYDIRKNGKGSFEKLKKAARSNPLFCPDTKIAKEMEKTLATVRRQGDSLGGIVEIVVRGCPAGLGEPVFDKIDADLAKALMSLGTVKAVEIGDGCEVSRKKGSEVNDQMGSHGFTSNHSGGILAGITTGEMIIIRVYCKPIPSISLPQQTLDVYGKERNIKLTGRHDGCVIPRIVPVCEAMVCIVLADHWLRQKAAKK